MHNFSAVFVLVNICNSFLVKAGQELMHTKAQGVIMMYDVTSVDSFSALPKYLSQVRSYGERDCVIVLVGNKTDLLSSQER